MDNKQLIKEFYENVVSCSRMDKVEHFVASDCKLSVGENQIPVGIEGMKKHIIDVKTTYPDLKIKILRQYTDGNFIISEIITEGTHKGEWLGIKPTGKKLTFTGVNIDRVVKQKIVEHGGAANVFDTFWQEKIIKPWSEINAETNH